MRRTRVAAVFVVAAVVAVAAAQGATPTKTYLRIAASGGFYYTLDYGSDPDAVYNGEYQKVIDWSMNGIAVYDGRSVSVPRGSMITAGVVFINDRRTQWRSATSRTPPRCTASRGRVDSGPGTRSWNVDTNGARFSSGRVTVSNSGLNVDPGPAIVWNIGCAATETLESHGLPGGPWFSVSAPGRSRFVGTKPFSTGCRDQYEHTFKRETGGNGHSFEGSVEFAVKFTPFPASQLTATKQRLRDRVGENISGSAQPSSWKDCL